MSKPKLDDVAAEPSSLPQIVCTLVVRTILDDCEVEICCQRSGGVDRVFSTSMDSLRGARPSESTLASSVEILCVPKIEFCNIGG